MILAVSRALGEAAPLLLVGAGDLRHGRPAQSVRGRLLGDAGADLQLRADPQDEFKLAAAGVILMLVVLLAMNSFAIWLRNRYEQQW